MKFKKLSSLLLTAVVSMSLVACSTEDTKDSQVEGENTQTEEKVETEDTKEETKEETKEAATHMVEVTNAAGEPIEVEFPTNPERLVVLNLQTLDFLDAVGMGDKIVGLIKDQSAPEHLQKYMKDDSITNVGGMKDIDMEAVMSLEPDVIFSSDRTEKKYDEFAAIAPTFAAYVDYDAGFMEGYNKLADKHSLILGVEDKVDSIIDGYEERIAKIDEFAGDQTALLGIFAGGLNTLGNTGRASIVVNEMGFENLAGDENVNHGNVSSYEAWLELNPDYMFILDKDTAVGAEGATAAKEQMEVNNPVIAQTDAYKNGKIIYLEPSTAWYLSDGGITSLDLMISSVEEGLGLK